MAKAGANVIIASRNEEQLSSLLEELPLLGNGEHEALVMDLEDTDSIQQSIQPFLDKGPIHILVNNAGGPPGGPLLNATVDELAQPFTRHLHAAHTLVKLLTPGMILANYGRIIQIVSTSVREPIPNLRSFQHITRSNGIMGKITLKGIASMHNHQQRSTRVYRYGTVGKFSTIHS